MIRWAAPLVLTLAACAASCNVLGIDPAAGLEYTDPTTGELVETTVGDAMADQLEAGGSILTSVAGKALGVATGNPVVGLSASALLAALLGTGTARLRRKKPAAGATAAPPADA